MKTIKLLFAVIATMLLAVSCGSNEPKSKVLVLYYSQTSNTKMVAEEIANKLGADIEEIVAVNPYDGDFNATIERCLKEREDGVIPEIKRVKSKINKYETIFIGYPIWFGTYAPPVAKFLQDVDLSGKKIIPFCTFGSGGLESSLKDLRKAQPNAKLMNAYGVRAARMDAMPAEVNQFLAENNYIRGEYVILEDFGDLHEVTEEESSIFNKAVADYPMIHAKALMAAMRRIPGGVEYLYLAEDLPREAKGDMPPAGQMKVYVQMMNGKSPVFTRVVR